MAMLWRKFYIDWDNKENVLKLVQQDGEYFYFVSERLRNDKDIVLAAVQQNWRIFDYVPEELRNDKDVLLAAIKQNGSFFRSIPKELRNVYRPPKVRPKNLTIGGRYFYG